MVYNSKLKSSKIPVRSNLIFVTIYICFTIFLFLIYGVFFKKEMFPAFTLMSRETILNFLFSQLVIVKYR